MYCLSRSETSDEICEAIAWERSREKLDSRIYRSRLRETLDSTAGLSIAGEVHSLYNIHVQ